MTGMQALRSAPDSKLFSGFAGPIIPSGMPRFPNPNGSGDLCGYAGVNTKRPPNRHGRKGIFGRTAMTRKRVVGDGDVSVYAHVRLLLLVNCLSDGPAPVNDFVRYVHRDSSRDAIRDGSGQVGTRDTGTEAGRWGGIYLRYIPACPVGVSRPPRMSRQLRARGQ